MTYLFPFVHESTHLIRSCVSHVILELRQFLEYLEFLLEVCLFHWTFVTHCLLLCVKESIACAAETLPDSIWVLAVDRTDLLPVLLELDEKVGSASPICTILEGFCFLAESNFLCKILVLLFLDCLVVFSLCLEECVTESAETLKEGIIDFLVGKA